MITIVIIRAPANHPEDVVGAKVITLWDGLSETRCRQVSNVSPNVSFEEELQQKNATINQLQKGYTESFEKHKSMQDTIEAIQKDKDATSLAKHQQEQLNERLQLELNDIKERQLEGILYVKI